MGGCHRFPFAELRCFQCQWSAEIGWLSPFFAFSDFHHGLLAQGVCVRKRRGRFAKVVASALTIVDSVRAGSFQFLALATGQHPREPAAGLA